MINFLFKWFNKDYCPSFPVGNPTIVERIIPYENIAFRKYVKGNVYLRKTTQRYKYRSPFFKGFSRTEYSGVIHAKLTDFNGEVEEKTIKLKPMVFESDYQFQIDLYKRYNFEEK